MKKRDRFRNLIDPPEGARWSEFQYFTREESTIDGREDAARVKRLFKAPAAPLTDTLRSDVRAGIQTMMLCAGMAPQRSEDVPWHIQYLAAHQFVQDFHAGLKLLTDDLLDRFSGIMVGVQTVRAALDRWEQSRKRPQTITAERLATLLEAPETPPVVRDLLRVACGSIDCFSAPRIEVSGGWDIDFQFSAYTPTPAAIRRKLPRMLRKVGHWRTAHDMPHELIELAEPAEEGGGDEQ